MLEGQQYIIIQDNRRILVATYCGTTNEGGITFASFRECAIIRRWGTEFGLGQIALQGITKKTILDKQSDSKVQWAKISETMRCLTPINVPEWTY